MTEQRAKADRYAQAILEAVLEQWQSSLTQVSDELTRNDQVRSTLESAQDSEARLQALQSITPKATSQEIQNFLQLLAQEGDLTLIPQVIDQLRSGVGGQRVPVKAEIVSAAELSEQEQSDIRRRLNEQHGDGLIFSFRVDPSLMGGLRVRVGDSLIDNTVASRLAALREMVSASVR